MSSVYLQPARSGRVHTVQYAMQAVLRLGLSNHLAQEQGPKTSKGRKCQSESVECQHAGLGVSVKVLAWRCDMVCKTDAKAIVYLGSLWLFVGFLHTSCGLRDFSVLEEDRARASC